MNQRKILAPTGYHVASDAEWTILSNYLGGVLVAGGKMKETGICHWKTPNSDATNISNFTGLPGGARDYLGVFPININDLGVWWTFTQGGSDQTYNRYLNYVNGGLARSTNYYESGFSVRLVKDFFSPFNFDLTNICPQFQVLLDNARGGVPPYQYCATYFTSESAAMANTNWFSGTDFVTYNMPQINGVTYWFVVKDSAGTILAKSILVTC